MIGSSHYALINNKATNKEGLELTHPANPRWIIMFWRYIFSILIFIFTVYGTRASTQEYELISRNWLASRTDIYLAVDSVRSLDAPGMYAAFSYSSYYTARDHIDTFGPLGEITGREFIGTFQSVGHIDAYDCNGDEKMPFFTIYYSTSAPSRQKIIHSIEHEMNFIPSFIEDLHDRVCEIGRDFP